MVVQNHQNQSVQSNVDAAMQSAWDKLNKKYRVERVETGYPNIGAQLDKLYHDMKDGKLGVAATTGSWFVVSQVLRLLFLNHHK